MNFNFEHYYCYCCSKRAPNFDHVLKLIRDNKTCYVHLNGWSRAMSVDTPGTATGTATAHLLRTSTRIDCIYYRKHGEK